MGDESTVVEKATSGARYGAQVLRRDEIDGDAVVVLAIHGGAGVISETVKKYGEAAYLDTLRAALAAGREVLANDGAAIDAVQQRSR